MPEKLSVTFKLDKDDYEHDLAEACSLARQGVAVLIIIPPGFHFDKPLELEDNITIQGNAEDLPPIILKS